MKLTIMSTFVLPAIFDWSLCFTHFRSSPVAATLATTTWYKQYQVRTAAVDLDINLNASAGIATGKRSSNNNSSTSNVNSSNNGQNRGINSNSSSSSLPQVYTGQLEVKLTPVSFIVVLVLTAKALRALSCLNRKRALLLDHSSDQVRKQHIC
jgi:hypothetical protein